MNPESRRGDSSGANGSPARGSESPIQSSLLPYLRLVRAPAVFSALGDPLAGVMIAGGRPALPRAAAAAGAVAALYLAGMALNDYADREEDAEERGERPIPSGAIAPERALALGCGLLATGLVAARSAGGGAAGATLAGAVVAYDFALKGSPVGPAAMGACRALSLVLGAQVAGGARGARRAAVAAALLGAYTAGLTLVARGETIREGNQTVGPGVLLSAAAVLAAAARGGRRSLAWGAVAAALAGPAAVAAARRPTPATTGKAVGAMIRAIPALDAALAAPAAPRAAAAVAVPLLALARWGRRLIPIS